MQLSLALAATLAGAIGDRWGTAAIFAVMGLLLLPAVAAGLLLRRESMSISGVPPKIRLLSS